MILSFSFFFFMYNSDLYESEERRKQLWRSGGQGKRQKRRKRGRWWWWWWWWWSTDLVGADQFFLAFVCKRTVVLFLLLFLATNDYTNRCLDREKCTISFRLDVNNEDLISLMRMLYFIKRISKTKHHIYESINYEMSVCDRQKKFIIKTSFLSDRNQSNWSREFLINFII